MVLLAVSDLHGEVDWLQDLIARHQPDVLLCAGDWGDAGQVSEDQHGSLLLQVRVLSIYGNHDDREMLERLRNRDGMPVLVGQGEIREVDGLRVAGISGIWAKTKLGSRLNAQWQSARRRNPSLTMERWLDGRTPPPYYTDDEIAALAAGLAGKEVDVLLLHGCPAGLADKTPDRGRGGQRCLRDAVQSMRPRLTLCGHLHRFQRADLPDGRAVLNTGYGAEGQGWLIRWNCGHWQAFPLR